MTTPLGVNEPLQSAFDALLFDLDGVIYVGPSAVPGAAEAIRAARAAGIGCGFVTNNASRPAEEVARHLSEIGIEAALDDVVTSPQAAVALLPQYVADGSAVLVIGGAGIETALRARGYRPVRTLEDDPAAVMQGFSPDVSWRDLAMATFAVRSGLPWIATNPDMTFPTADGIAPGNGALVRVVAETAGRLPVAVAGKPEPPLLREAMRRLDAERPLMVGDRLDTDVAAGARVGLPTLLVLTGVTDVRALLGARGAERPTYVGPDLGVLARPYPPEGRDGDWFIAGQARARLAGGRCELVAEAGTDRWDAIRAAARACWAADDAGESIDLDSAAGALEGGTVGSAHGA